MVIFVKEGRVFVDVVFSFLLCVLIMRFVKLLNVSFVSKSLLIADYSFDCCENFQII